MKYVFLEIKNPGNELTQAGITSGMEFTAQMMHNGAAYFHFFNKNWIACVAWPQEYNVLVNHSLSKQYDEHFKDLKIYDVESLFDPDSEEEILVIKVSELTRHQKDFLNIA
jgi:hypothetical protein